MVERLQLLVQHRRISRQILRGEYLLSLPQPVYSPPPKKIKKPLNNNNNNFNNQDNEIQKYDEKKENEMQRLQKAVNFISELQQLADQLWQEKWALKQRMEVLYENSDGLQQVKQKLIGVSNSLKERAKTEVQNLPQRSLSEAQKELAKMQRDQKEEAGGPIGRLERAEKKAGKFVVDRIQPTVKRVQETEDVGAAFRDAVVYAKELWTRLNGGAVLKESANCPLPCINPTQLPPRIPQNPSKTSKFALKLSKKISNK
eukprot:TRINITY_DN27575_c0_g3_i1.p1 TRINITY_DN27575_c0_g3~~TRINITY_DN27575_c0_g3_i1.p1  ORF type:complete len:258 (-),score=53.43 TRINITY_DN27575_c0_g3_i1:25-798(-)